MNNKMVEAETTLLTLAQISNKECKCITKNIYLNYANYGMEIITQWGL